MSRIALAVLVVAAGSTTVTTQDHATSPEAVVASPPTSREPELRPSRSIRRHPLPATSYRALRGNPFLGKARRTVGLRDWRGWLSTTMYCATGHRTASGVWPEVGMAAGNRWPFGTQLDVPGVGVVTITDRIGSGSDLDIFGGNDTGCEARALTWGRRSLLVEAVG